MSASSLGLGRVGRLIGASSVLLGAGGILVLLAGGATDLLVVDFALHNGLLGIGFGAVTWLIARSQPRNRAAWALAGAALFSALYAAADAALFVIGPSVGVEVSLEAIADQSPATVPTSIAVFAALLSWTWLPGIFLPLTFGLLLFPDGRLPSARWRPVGYATGAALILATAAMFTAFLPGSVNRYGTENFGDFEGFASTLALSMPVLALLSLVCAASLVVRYRAGAAIARRQIRWIAAGGGVLILSLATGMALDGVGSGASRWDHLIIIGIVLLPVSFGVAILKYRLYDIDVVISKGVTYLALAGAITALYAGVVVAPVLILGASEERGTTGLILPIVATAIVAIAFEPLRAGLQGWANRLVYGERATPHELLSEVTVRLSDVSDAEATLSGLASLLQQGTGAENASVWLEIGGSMRPAAASPEEHLDRLQRTEGTDDAGGTNALTVPVVHGGESLGALRIDKPRNDPVTPADQQLLEDVAAAAGLRLRNLRLQAALAERADELRASRRRLIAAHDAARHRLERDLHDGAQQQVVALKVKLGLAKSIAEREGAHEVATSIDRLAEGTQEAVDEMRLLARGIYPPLLEAEGLAATLAGLDRHADLPVAVTTDGLGRYSRSIEETVYFCAAALVSIGAMAGASAVELDVARGDRLRMTARFPGVSAGVDLATLSDRVDAMGGRIDASAGGPTHVVVTLPAEALEPV